MGQTTVGILFGVRSPEDVELRDEESDDEPTGLLDRWERECVQLIAAHDDNRDALIRATPGLMPYEVEDGTARYVPDVEYDSDPPVFGFWIAVGASGKAEVPSLENLAMPAARVKTDERFVKAYCSAKRRWSRFARWARAQGVEVGKPRLWRVETEVA